MTIKQFQELYYISTSKDDDIDKSIKMVGCMTGKIPEQVEKMSALKFNFICRQITKQFETLAKNWLKTKPRKLIYVNGHIYRLHYDVQRLKAGKYVDALTFSKDIIENLHKLMATMAEPVNWFGRPVKRSHQDIAADMEDINFEAAYHAAVFFLHIISGINARYPALFGKADNEEGGEPGDSDTASEQFLQHFGWIANASMVAEFERIPVEQVWGLGVTHFLNDLLYIKFKNKYDADQYRKSTAAGISGGR